MITIDSTPSEIVADFITMVETLRYKAPGVYDDKLNRARYWMTIHNANILADALRASESRPAGIEPRGCPMPGACMCHPDAVAKAVEAEREACAKIAEFLKTLKCWLPTDSCGEGESEHATVHGEEIAAAIRARATSPSPPFDEAAERKVFAAWLEALPFKRTRDLYGLVESAWLASAQRRRV